MGFGDKEHPAREGNARLPAVSIVRSIEKGAAQIFPDPIARQVEQLWANNDRQLDRINCVFDNVGVVQLHTMLLHIAIRASSSFADRYRVMTANQWSQELGSHPAKARDDLERLVDGSNNGELLVRIAPDAV